VKLLIIEARTVTAARAAMSRDAPDVTIIDINLPNGSGLELTREFIADVSDNTTWRARPSVSQKRLTNQFSR
jgi:DNA-binding NarL/FixJ family response regulator